MNDIAHAATFFMIFAVVLVAYGAVLARTGDKELLPYRAMYSVRGPEDVKRAGRIVINVGLIIGALALVTRLIVS